MSATASLAWNLISDDTVTQTRGKGSLNEKDALQLKGIFISLDDDKDGLLNSSQLVEALKLLGFPPREKLIKKFYASTTQNKAMYQPKTNFKTFITVVSKEMERFQAVSEEISIILDFIDSEGTGYITKTELRHLLVDTPSNTTLGMSSLEFNRFVKNITGSVDTERINIQLLKKKIIFGLDLK